MSAVGYVTAAAAGLAAILSGVNLWLAGQREINSWAREALVEALVSFFDTSFKLRGSCRRLIHLAVEKEFEAQEIRLEIVAAHNLETDTLTRLRLLAPSRVVRAAEGLHEADHRVIDAYFSDSPHVEYSQALINTRLASAKYISAARSAFRLRDTAAMRHNHDDTSWWRFRDDTAALTAQQAPSRSANRHSPGAGSGPG